VTSNIPFFGCATVDPVVVEMANHFWYIHSQAAREILDYTPRDWRETLAESVAYISTYGHFMVFFLVKVEHSFCTQKNNLHRIVESVLCVQFCVSVDVCIFIYVHT